MTQQWDTELLEKDRYRKVFARLRARAHHNTYLLRTAPVHPPLTLRWVLDHESEVTRCLRESVKNGEVTFDRFVRSDAILDKKRTIYMSAWPERILQMVMAEILGEFLAPSIPTAVYSYQRGKNAKMALENFRSHLKRWRHGPVFVLKRDIASYGDSIPQKSLFAHLAEKTDMGNSEFFLPLLKSAVQCRYIDGSGEEHQLEKGLPSGSPLVPPLENWYLRDLDNRLLTMRGFYGRYGDDFIFATPDRSIAETADHVIIEECARLGLTINDRKASNTVITLRAVVGNSSFQPVRGVEWLGMRVNAKGVGIGIKTENSNIVMRYFCGECQALIQKLGDPRLERAQKIAILKKGVATLFSFKTPMLQVLLKNENDNLYRLFDHEITHVIVRALRIHWRISKSDAWRIYRRIDRPSLRALKWRRHKNETSRTAA